MSQIENLEASIAKQTKELADLKQQLKEAEELAKNAPDQILADTLHTLLCRHNHTDGCGWYYEFKDKKAQWGGYAHSEYLKKAQKLICKCNELNINPDDAIKIFKLVNTVTV